MSDIPIAAFRFAAETKDAKKEVSDLHSALLGLNKTTFKDLDLSVGGLAKTFGGLLPVLSAGAFAGFIQSSISSALAIDDMADRAGIATSQFSRLKYAADQTDVSTSALEAGIKNLQKTTAEAATGNIAAAKTFADMGINISEFVKLKPDERFIETAGALSKLTDESLRIALANDVFKKSAYELGPMLALSSDRLRELTDAAVALDDHGVKALDRSSKALGRLWDAIRNGTANFAGGIAVTVLGYSDEIEQLEARIDRVRVARDRLADQSSTDKRRKAIAEDDALITQLEQRVEFLKALADGVKVTAGSRISALESGELSEVGGDGTLAAAKRRRDSEFRDSQSKPFADADEGERIKKHTEMVKQASKDEAKEIKEGAEAAAQAQIDANQRSIDAIIASKDVRLEVAYGVNDILNDLALGRANFEVDVDRAKNQSLLQTGVQLLGAALGFNKKHAKIAKALASAQTIWATGRAVMEAAPVWPAMAAIAAAGAINLAKINATNYSESGTSGAGIGFTAADFSSPAAQTSTDSRIASAPEARGTIEIHVAGDWFDSRETAQWLTSTLKDAFDRDVVLISANSSQAHELAPK